MNKPLGRAAVIAVTAVLLSCQSEEAIDAAQEASTLGSMDEQYAWVETLETAMPSPAKPSTLKTAPAVTRLRFIKRPILLG